MTPRARRPPRGDASSILLGPRAPARARRHRSLAERLGIPIVATGDLFRAARPRGHAARHGGAPVHGRGPARARRRDVRLSSTASASPTPRDGVILDGFPRTGVQAEALDRLARRPAAGHRGRCYIEVPSDELDPAAGRAAGLHGRRAARRTTRRQPAQVAGRLRHRRHGARTSGPTTSRRPSGPGWPSSCGADVRGRRPLPETGAPAPCAATGRSTRSPTSSLRARAAGDRGGLTWRSGSAG